VRQCLIDKRNQMIERNGICSVDPDGGKKRKNAKKAKTDEFDIR